MISGRLSDFARGIEAQVVGADAAFTGIAIDSRRLAPGNLFVALPGTRVDGHDYLAAAADAGAAASLSRPPAGQLPALVTTEPADAMAALASLWRARFDLPVVGITGSNGKTTVKEMIAAILAQGGPVLATQGNLNNALGVPLTLARLEPAHVAAVIEMGASGPGEIAMLAACARPQVAVITNAGPAHLEGFGTIAGVARAKGELYEALPAEGTAVINADDTYASLWRSLAAPRRCLQFGRAAEADIRLLEAGPGEVEGTQRFRLQTPGGELEGALPLPGVHNLHNAMAAVAVAIALDCEPARILAGLASVRLPGGRLAMRAGIDGLRLIDDSYNANPASVLAAADVLAALPGPRWLALGELAELGEGGLSLVSELGRQLRERGVERLFTIGSQAGALTGAFGPGATACESVEALIAALREALATETSAPVLLVKGSRAGRMERVITALAKE